jgi:hypothetical protein
MTEAVLAANPKPGVWTLIGGDVASDHLIPDPAADAITCLLDRIRLLEQEVGIQGCLPGGTELQGECSNCDAQRVCEPPEQTGLGVAGRPRGAAV